MGSEGNAGEGELGLGLGGGGGVGVVCVESVAGRGGWRSRSGEDRAGPYLCTRMAEEECKGVSAGREGGSV